MRWCLISLTIILIYLTYLFPNVFALTSPSFPIQQIFDNIHDDWNLVTIGNGSEIYDSYNKFHYHEPTNVSSCVSKGTDPLANIEGISYISDGRKLNATFWLTSQIKKLPLKVNFTDSGKYSQATVDIKVSPTTLSLEHFTSLYIKNLTSQSSNIIRNGSSILNGMNNTNIEFQTVDKKHFASLFKNNDKVYIISYHAEPEIYADYLPDEENMVKSFRIHNSTDYSKNMNQRALSNSSESSLFNENLLPGVNKYLNTKYGFEMIYFNTWQKVEPLSDNVVEFRAHLYEDNTLNVFGQSYFILIDSVADHEGTSSDYMFELTWDNNTKNWKQLLKEISPSNEHDYILKTNDVNSDMINYSKNYVPLSFDLASINFPEKYSVNFGLIYKFLKGNLLCYLQDVTNIFSIPQPEFNITLSPSSLRLKPGQEKTVQLEVRSNSHFNSEAFFKTANKIEGLEVVLDPNTTSVPADSTAGSLIKVKALDNAAVKPYTFVITLGLFPNITFTNQQGNTIEGTGNNILAINNLALPITVEEPLGVFDYFNNALNTWGTSVRNFFEITGIIVGVFITIIGILKEARKREARKRAKQ